MLTWPRPDGDFGPHYAEVIRCFARIAVSAAQMQRVIVTVESAAREREARALIDRDDSLGRIQFYILPSDDVWARDHGPIAVNTPSGPQLRDFRFNGWGGKYPASADNALSARLHAAGAFGSWPLRSVDFTLEGGAIETNGADVLLATRRSVLDPARNTDCSQATAESVLRQELGLCHFHWLEHGGIAGDDTDGHIDTLARFVARDHIVYQGSAGPDDPSHAALSALETELQGLRDPQGKPYRLTRLPAPCPLRSRGGDPLPAGYANFCLINGAVLLPTYADPNDAQAQAILQSCFPGRRIIPIDSRPLIEQYGSIHCVTMHIPELT